MNRRLLRASLALLAGWLLASVPATGVLACSCMQLSISEALGFADVAFIGTAAEAEAPPPQPGDVLPNVDRVRYGFEVERVFKGEEVDARIVIITTTADGASCGTSFAIGERWLVFANVTDGELWTGLCSGTAPLLDPEAEQAVLDELGSPIAQPAAPSEGTQSEPPVALVAVLAAVALVAAISAWAFLREPARPAG